MSLEEADRGRAELRRERREIAGFRERHGLAELDAARERLVAERDALARRLATEPAGGLADVAAKLRRLVRAGGSCAGAAAAAERVDLARTALDGVERLLGRRA